MLSSCDTHHASIYDVSLDIDNPNTENFLACAHVCNKEMLCSSCTGLDYDVVQPRSETPIVLLIKSIVEYFYLIHVTNEK